MNCTLPFALGALTAVVLWPGVAHAQPVPDETVSVHVRELKHENPLIRHAAATSLWSLGERAAAAVPALTAALSDKVPSVRWEAASALGRMGQHAASAVPALTEMLSRDDEAYARQAALETLAQIAPAVVTNVPELAVGIKSAEMRQRRWSAEALARLEENAQPALKELIIALKDEASEVRAVAAMALRNLRENARPAVGPLIVALQDKEAKVRENAAEALGYIGPGAEDAVPHLIKALSDPVGAVRDHAARAFTRDWPGAERALPALIKALDSETSNTGYALEGLARHGHSQVVVPALLEYLQRRGHWSAIHALGQIGPDARAAIPVLKDFLKSKQPGLRRAAAEALSKIGGSVDEGVQSLIADLRSDDASTREDAARSLGEIGPAARAAVPELMALLEDQNQRAFAAFNQSAETGVAEAQFALAVQYRDGVGTPPDIAAAASWFQKAAEQNHAEAQRHLGILHRQGRGVPQDDHLAEQWYRKAAEPTGALARLKNQSIDQSPFPSAVSTHAPTDSSEFGTQEKLLLAVTGFSQDATCSYNHRIGSSGSFDAYHDCPLSTRGGVTVPHFLSQPEIDRLNALFKALPEGVEFVPLEQKLFVSCRIGDRWTSRFYDTENIPRVVRLLLEMIEAPVKAAPYPPQEQKTWTAQAQPPLGLTYRADGTLLSWGHERKIYHWRNGQLDAADDSIRSQLPGYPIAAAGDRVVTSEQQQLKLWNLKTGKHVADVGQSSDWHDRPGEAIFSADGQTLLIQQSRHHQVNVWDTGSGRFRGAIQVGQFFNPSIAVSADGKQLAVCSSDSTIRVWDLTTFKLKRKIGEFSTHCLAFSPDGKVLAGIGREKGNGLEQLVIWDLETGEKRFQVRAGNDSKMLCFSPDGAFVAAKREQRLIKLWDANDGQVLGIAEGHTGEITALTVSPDGKEIASSSDDGTVKLWSVEKLVREGRTK
jgi:HEAT repeat protein/WD40 repeat protein